MAIKEAEPKREKPKILSKLELASLLEEVGYQVVTSEQSVDGVMVFGGGSYQYKGGVRGQRYYAIDRWGMIGWQRASDSEKPLESAIRNLWGREEKMNCLRDPTSYMVRKQSKVLDSLHSQKLDS